MLSLLVSNFKPGILY